MKFPLIQTIGVHVRLEPKNLQETCVSPRRQASDHLTLLAFRHSATKVNAVNNRFGKRDKVSLFALDLPVLNPNAAIEELNPVAAW